MDKHPLRTALLVGSTREGRFGDTVAHWFATRAEQRSDIVLEVIDLAHVQLPPVIPEGSSEVVEAFARRIARQDAFVVVTPEYNHSFPASLKQAIDLVYAGWKAKPVAFVSYGGVSGGLRAVEQLRQVFAELHTVTVRDTVSFHGARSAFDAAGQPESPRANVAADKLLNALVWWGHALRSARAEHPYPA